MTTIIQLLKLSRQALLSRTVQFALIVAILGALQGFVFLLPVTPLQQMYASITLSVLIVFFRFITTQSISEK